MLVLILALSTIACSVSASPYRQRRYYDSFSYPFAMASAGASSGPFGSFSGSGFPFYNNFNPFYFPMTFPPFPVFPDIRMPEPWYKGPNVCESQEKIQSDTLKEWSTMGFSGNQESESCRSDNDHYVCLRSQGNPPETTVTKYFCCDGYVRPSNVHQTGCVEINIRNLMPTLRSMDASRLVKLIENVGMADDFHNNNYTVFCPPNTALDAMQNELEDQIDNEIAIKITQQKLRKKTLLYNLVTSHLSPGFFKIDNLADGKILPTDNPECEIRINVYFTPVRVITANCVPVTSGDHFARNGIIHLVEKVLPIPKKTVADIIAGDTQFSILKRMLSMAGLVQTLRNPNGSFTMFAPTDSALKSHFYYQNEESGNRCTVSVTKHHIADHVICSAALPHQARILNMIGELLSLSRDQNNKLYVDDVQIVVRDLMATNGVVHIIDGILSTHQTKPLSQVLEESEQFEILSLLESVNLTSEFDCLENVTFFIPTDEVMLSIPPRHLEALLNYNNQSIENVLRFHVVEGQAELSKPDQLLQSKLENSSIRFQVYTKYPKMIPQVLVQCATVLIPDIKLCGGTLHVIDKLLLPPKLTITEFLESIEGFSTLVLLLRTTGLDKRLSREEAAFTLFAPTDDAFHQMGDETIFRLLEDVESAKDLLKMHIMLGSVCCSQLNNDMMSGRTQTRTMDGTLLNLDRSVDSILMVGGGHVVECDIMTTTGVIHMVDAVLTYDQTSFTGGGFFDNLFNLI